MILKSQSLMVLASAIAVVFIGVWLVKPQPTETIVLAKERFFPGLMEQLNDVSRIEITTPGQSFTITNQNGEWTVPAKADFPASGAKIREVLYGLAELIPLEKKTSNPDYYARIQLQDITQEDSQATKIELTNATGQAIAALLLGKEQNAKTHPELTELFVRVPSESQSWLTLGALPIYNNPLDWIDNTLLDIGEQNIRSVRLQRAGGKTLLLSKAENGSTDFQIADFPEDKEVTSQFNVNYIASTFGSLTIDNVLPRQEINGVPSEGTATLETFDGLQIVANILPYRNKTAVQLHAALVDGLSEAEQQALQPKVAQLEQKFQRWAFEIPLYQASELKKELPDLLKQPEQAAS